MSIRRLMAMAACGLMMTLATGPLSPLQAQGGDVEADADLIRAVTAKHLQEIRLGELAQKMTTHSNIRQFGDRMIAEHTDMHKRWSALVGKDGKPFTPSWSEMRFEEVTRLSNVSATKFDKEYMASAIRLHQEDVTFFQNAPNSARSTQVRELLARDLPVLQQHLNLAVQVGSQVGAAPAVAAGNQGGQNAPTATPPPPGVPVTQESAQANAIKKDSKFIRNASADNTLEIQLAQLAEKKTTHTGIRQLAKRVIDDHTAMQNRWISLATNNGMNLKPGMGKRHREKVERLDKASATEFDRAYATMLIQNNQDYVEYFGKEGRAAHTTQVRNLAANDLPILQQHLSQAKQIAEQLGVDTDAALSARQTAEYRK